MVRAPTGRRYRPAVFTLAQLEQAIRDSWSFDTSDEDAWSPENGGRGQCDITSSSFTTSLVAR
jgi:hypothetical protein